MEDENETYFKRTLRSQSNVRSNANSNGNPVRLQEISNRQNISLHHLEQLFRKLRNRQAVKSVRGPGGGYVLARHMDEISVKDILDCVGETLTPARDILGNGDEQANNN